MRIYSEIEREMIRYLNSEQKQRGQKNLKGIMDQYLDGTLISLDLTPEKAEFLFEKPSSDDEIQWVLNKAEELQEIIVVLLKSIEYLEKNGFIVIYSITADRHSNSIKFGKGVEDQCELPYPFSDQNIASLLVSYMNKEIIPLGTLLQLEKNKFVPLEDVRFRRQQIGTWFAIGVALFLGIAGIVWNIISSTQQSSLENERLIVEKKAISNIERRINELEKLELERTSEMKNMSELLADVLKSDSAEHKDKIIELSPMKKNRTN